MSRKTSRNNSRINRLRPLASLLAAGLSLPALAAAQSNPYPTYETGPLPNGAWVVSSGQVITPAGKQVNLGNQVRAKAIALNPNVRRRKLSRDVHRGHGFANGHLEPAGIAVEEHRTVLHRLSERHHSGHG